MNEAYPVAHPNISMFVSVIKDKSLEYLSRIKRVQSGAEDAPVHNTHIIIPEIPLSNAIGWLLTGIGLMAILHKVLRRDRRKVTGSTSIPDFFLIWTWFAGVVGNIFFFDRVGVAVSGGIIFGLFLIPYLFLLRFGPPANS